VATRRRHHPHRAGPHPPGPSHPTAALTPGALGRLLCEATLQRVLTTPDGPPLTLGRSTRLATPAQRRALAVRDGGCVIPACTAPATWCDAHHLTPWATGGGTDLTNLLLLCPRHHTAVHTGTWTIRLRDGIPWVTPPRWADPTGTPTRNTTHRAARDADHLGQQLRLLLNDPDDPDP
jgi:hypothetical protein